MVDGIYTGLDYPAVDVVLTAFVPGGRRRDVFDDVQLMERTLLPLLNKRDKNGKP